MKDYTSLYDLRKNPDHLVKIREAESAGMIAAVEKFGQPWYPTMVVERILGIEQENSSDIVGLTDTVLVSSNHFDDPSYRDIFDDDDEDFDDDIDDDDDDDDDDSFPDDYDPFGYDRDYEPMVADDNDMIL